jgi:hypothetical protein
VVIRFSAPHPRATEVADVHDSIGASLVRARFAVEITPQPVVEEDEPLFWFAANTLQSF